MADALFATFRRLSPRAASSPLRSILVIVLVLLAGILFPASNAPGQDLVERHPDLLDRLVSEVVLQGLNRADEQLVLNNLRCGTGQPYDAVIIKADVRRLYNLGRFKSVTAEARLRDDGTVQIIYSLAIQPIIYVVQTIGNSALSDQDLAKVIRQASGGPRDDYLIEGTKREIIQLYRSKGFYLTDVTVDRGELERGVLIFNVIEGPRVRIRGIEFEGNEAFLDKRLHAEIKTSTHIFIFRAGALDEDVLTTDIAAIDQFYKSRGYLDVRVDHGVELSPDNKEAKVIYYVSEGRPYTLRSVRTENLDDPSRPLALLSDEQIAALMTIKTGDVYSRDKLRESVDRLQRAYGGMGRIDARVHSSELRSGPEAEVDLLLEIYEGSPVKVGEVLISGNILTRDKVIRRLLTFQPGRPFDLTQVQESERRIKNSRLFGEVKVTVMDAFDVTSDYRDVLIEVRERNTGSVGFGVAVGSDSGLFGEISVNQENFDLYDLPETLKELISGRAFRGAGQKFSMTFRPGNEFFQYSMSFTEPHLFDSDYSISVSGSFRDRTFDQYDEVRTTGTVALGRKLGDVWSGSVRLRAARIELEDIDAASPTEIFLDAGPDNLTGVGLSLIRSTIGTINRPGSGSRLELDLESVGLLGGDFDFYNANAEYTVFLTLDQDFLGRKSILKLTTAGGYIFGESGHVPTYERYYRGGRSFRGFDFRTVSPKGARNDTGDVESDPVGGLFSFFAGGQYEYPLVGETVTGVFFVDSGTVIDDIGFSDYRVSAGLGLRLYLEALGPLPIAFDFGFPIQMGPGDEKQVFTFSAEFPF